MRLVIAAGGTGGHIIPALAIALAWRSLGREVVWYGRQNALEHTIAKQYNIDFFHVDACGLGGVKQLPIRCLRIARYANHARALLKRHKAFCVFSTGSFAGFPTALASFMAGVPLILQEQNSIMGLSNKILLPFSDSLFLGMQIFGLPKDWVVGNPLLINPKKTKGQALLILGGSQGSHFFNHDLIQLLQERQWHLPIVHIAGKHKQEVEKQYKKTDLQVTVYDFVHNMEPIFECAQMAICRAGAMTLSEIAAYQIPSILIPYPYAKNDHQRKNAEHYYHQGAALLATEHTLTIHNALTQLLKKEKQQRIKQVLSTIQHHAAVDNIIERISTLYAQTLSHQ